MSTLRAWQRASRNQPVVFPVAKRMYRPHEAREDVLFPALRTIVPAERIDELGEPFEEEEHRLFGEGGFDKMVEQVTNIEKQLGIHDLGQFTPK